MELLTKMEGSDREVLVNYDFGESLYQMKSILTQKGVKDVDGVIFSNARANMKVAARSVIKAGMKGPKDRGPLTDEEIQAKLDSWVPGMASEKEPVDPKKRLASTAKAFDQLTPEEQEQYIADLKARLKATA